MNPLKKEIKARYLQRMQNRAADTYIKPMYILYVSNKCQDKCKYRKNKKNMMMI